MRICQQATTTTWNDLLMKLFVINLKPSNLYIVYSFPLNALNVFSLHVDTYINRKWNEPKAISKVAYLHYYCFICLGRDNNLLLFLLPPSLSTILLNLTLQNLFKSHFVYHWSIKSSLVFSSFILMKKKTKTMQHKSSKKKSIAKGIFLLWKKRREERRRNLEQSFFKLDLIVLSFIHSCIHISFIYTTFFKVIKNISAPFQSLILW